MNTIPVFLQDKEKEIIRNKDGYTLLKRDEIIITQLQHMHFPSRNSSNPCNMKIGLLDIDGQIFKSIEFKDYNTAKKWKLWKPSL